jgi:hypothetical protein
MMTLQILSPRCRRLLLVAFYLQSVLPALPAQTGKDLITDACYNARQQLEDKSLWSSRIERRTGGHVYLEKEIETVDGPVHHLISVDAHEPSPSERKQDDDRNHDLTQSPKARLTLKRDHEADRRKVADLLRAIPEAFLFDDQGNQGGLEKVAFRPNPRYKPETYEARALHAMSGIILVDMEEKQLAEVSATLIQQVDFGYGAVGRLNKGGTINVTRARVSPGIWKTSSSRIDINSRFIFFKTISKHQDDRHIDFNSVASDTSIAQALQQLGGK